MMQLTRAEIDSMRRMNEMRADFNMYMIKFTDKYDPSYAELISLLSREIAQLSKYMLREEREEQNEDEDDEEAEDEDLD